MLLMLAQLLSNLFLLPKIFSDFSSLTAMEATVSNLGLIFLIIFVDARIPLATEECQAMIDLKTDPETCCTLPQPSYYPENEVNCQDECSSVKRRRRCCIRKCRVEKLGIYVNETFNKKALIDFLLSESGMKKIWSDEVEKAVASCAEKCNVFYL